MASNQRIHSAPKEIRQSDYLLSTDDKEDIPTRKTETRIKNSDDIKKYFSGLEAEIEMSTRFTVSIENFFAILQALAQNSKQKENTSRYYFRGESTTEYNLLPTLLRDNVFESLDEIHDSKQNPIELQKKLLDRFRRYTQHIIHSDNDFKAPIWEDFDTLCLAQHFGLPTLLMDWTLNPYVAAYFAVSNAYRRVLREKLWAFPRIEKYCIRVWVMRLKNPEVRKDYTVHLEDREKSKDSSKKYLYNTQSQPRAPLIVVPLVFTRRIAAQVGRFVYCGYMATTPYKPEQTVSLAKYSYECAKSKHLSWDQLYSLDVEFDISKQLNRIRKDYDGWDEKKQKDEKFELFNLELMKMIRELDFIGFNAGRLFPDLEGWARYLREGNL